LSKKILKLLVNVIASHTFCNDYSGGEWREAISLTSLKIDSKLCNYRFI